MRIDVTSLALGEHDDGWACLALVLASNAAAFESGACDWPGSLALLTRVKGRIVFEVREHGLLADGRWEFAAPLPVRGELPPALERARTAVIGSDGRGWDVIAAWSATGDAIELWQVWSRDEPDGVRLGSFDALFADLVDMALAPEDYSREQIVLTQPRPDELRELLMAALDQRETARAERRTELERIEAAIERGEDLLEAWERAQAAVDRLSHARWARLVCR